MGWRLAEEIAWARPEHPGPEWWTLMDIAQDARDETRQGMPGMEYLMARGKCSRATLYRRLKALTDGKLITVARRSAPGVRAIYEIGEVLRLPDTGLTNAETRSGLTDAETRPPANESHPDANGSQNPAQRVSAFVTPTPSVVPVTTTPSPPTAQVVTPEPGNHFGDRAMSRFEYEAWQQVQQARRSRNA